MGEALARVGEGQHRVGKYTVRVNEFQSLALDCLRKEVVADSPLIIVDEVGKMECLSKAFQTRVRQLFNEAVQHLVVTIPVVGRGGRELPLVKELKDRQDTELVVVTLGNREGLK